MNEEPSYDWFNRTKKYKLLCDKVIVLDNQLRSIKSHVDDLAEYFNCLNISEFSDTANWFSMAWAIKTIEYEEAKYFYDMDPYQVANGYTQATQKLRTNLMDDITRFLYIYMGLESLLNNLKLKKCPKEKGKIKAATFYIKKHNHLIPEIPFYQEHIDLLLELVDNSGLRDMKNLFSSEDCNCSRGIGLKVLYKLRNKLSHGNFEFPLDEDLSEHMPLEPQITKLCSRLLLMSTQMIMIVKRNGLYSSLFSPHIEISDELDFLINCHLPQQ